MPDLSESHTGLQLYRQKEMVEEQFSIFGNGEGVSLKRISFKIFVKDFSPIAFCHASTACDLNQEMAEC